MWSFRFISINPVHSVFSIKLYKLHKHISVILHLHSLPLGGYHNVTSTCSYSQTPMSHSLKTARKITTHPKTNILMFLFPIFIPSLSVAGGGSWAQIPLGPAASALYRGVGRQPPRGREPPVIPTRPGPGQPQPGATAYALGVTRCCRHQLRGANNP